MNDTSKYLQLFVSEATRHTDQLIRHCPALLGESFQADLLEELFRHAHSLRGMSAAMGFQEIVALAQATEHLLGELRGQSVRLSAASGRTLTEATALLREMIAARGEGRIAADEPALVGALGQATFESQSPAVEP